jgi:F0F1-type ATP synthase assembly protein I
MLFMVYAAADLPSPWRMIVIVLGLAAGVPAVASGVAVVAARPLYRALLRNESRRG